MCKMCFNHYVATNGFPHTTFQDQLQVVGVALALLHHPDVSTDDHGRYIYAAGGLHVAVEDDQYDLEITDGSVAGMAWNQLPEPLRVLVVAVIKGYQLPDGRVFHIAADGTLVITADGFKSTVNYRHLVPRGAS